MSHAPDHEPGPGSSLLDVTGETSVYVVIGDPVAQVRSTRLYNSLCAGNGIDAVFIPLQFSAAGFDAAITGLRGFRNITGIIPTIPHKPRMIEVVDRASERARMVGAVNSIRVEEDGSWTGDMFDGIGYVRGLKNNGIDPAGKSVLLLGAGGAGSAIAFALAEAGIRQLCISDVDELKALHVRDAVKDKFPELDADSNSWDPRGYDIIANATPLGMEVSDPLPIGVESISADQIVTDMIMKPPMTKLLDYAHGIGCPTVAGHQALLGQADANMRFFGLSPATQVG